MGGLSLISIILSVLTGERVNFLIRACSGMLAALVWRPNWRRYGVLIVVEIFAVLAILLSSPTIQERYVDKFAAQLPTGAHSPYYRVMAAGPEAAKESLIFGLGPATFRDLCPKIIGVSSEYECDNHPHNFYSQLLTETGVIGLIAGSIMMISIIWAAFAGWRQNRANVVAATAFVIPFGLFFPVQSTGDFFGQWNNIFMWSAIGLALAAARTLVPYKPKLSFAYLSPPDKGHFWCHHCHKLNICIKRQIRHMQNRRGYMRHIHCGLGSNATIGLRHAGCHRLCHVG